MRADLALIGFGNVGQRLASLLEAQRGLFRATYGVEYRIVAIATARHGAAANPQGLDAVAAADAIRSGGTLAGFQASDAPAVADSFDAIARVAASDADIRIVVETTTLDIRAGRPAMDHVSTAIDAGCDVVTANKGPVAFAYAELERRAALRGASFLFEGAVMDGVPIFNLVRETLPGVHVLGFRGVVNSTTNHILSALEDGDDFAPALARMQAEGIAEADASLDVDGWDAAAKAAALANVLMNARTTPHRVKRTGIGPENAVQALEARRHGRRLRLVASARGERDSVRIEVRPIELPETDLLAGLRGMANALVLQTDLLGEIAICQLEGGLTQTAYALLADAVTVVRRRQARGGVKAHRTP